MQSTQLLIGLDAAIFAASILLCLALRFGLGPWMAWYVLVGGWMVAVPPGLKLGVFWLFGVNRILWRYARTVDFVTVAAASTLASVVLFIVSYVIAPEILGPAKLPRSVIALDWFVTTVAVLAPRWRRRMSWNEKSPVS